MKSTAIVTMSDAKYFNLLMELIDSILRFNESKDISICVLDVGLKDQQINILSSQKEDLFSAKNKILSFENKAKATKAEIIKERLNKSQFLSNNLFLLKDFLFSILFLDLF